jgi:hypothetical protein
VRASVRVRVRVRVTVRVRGTTSLARAIGRRTVGPSPMISSRTVRDAFTAWRLGAGLESGPLRVGNGQDSQGAERGEREREREREDRERERRVERERERGVREKRGREERGEREKGPPQSARAGQVGSAWEPMKI